MHELLPLDCLKGLSMVLGDAVDERGSAELKTIQIHQTESGTIAPGGNLFSPLEGRSKTRSK